MSCFKQFFCTYLITEYNGNQFNKNLIKMTHFVDTDSIIKNYFKDYLTDHGQLNISDQTIFK